MLSQKACHLGRAPARRPLRCVASEVATTTTTRIVVKQHGTASIRGSSRKVNEDRVDVKVAASKPAPGEPFAWAGVYDGHGGSAVADWLQKKLFGFVEGEWSQGFKPEFAIGEAFLAADRKLLSVGAGFMGMGERGVGGSKCGATAANALLFQDADGSTKLLTANVGDARVVLVRGSEAVQLTEDHVPDVEKERIRIEQMNPNPKLPLVRYVGGTWRVGGLLALSRAFGDAYLKGSLQFEGRAQGSDGYSSGFGVIAQPYTALTTLTDEDSWLVVASDGLFAEEERGGGGGLDNKQLVEILSGVSPGADLTKVAATLAQTAMDIGSTDDISLVVMRLGST